MRQMLTRFMCLTGSLTLLTGCVLDELEFYKPVMPQNWFASEANKETFDDAQVKELSGWWQKFDDPILNDLINTALESSPTRKQAEARIIEARGEKRTSRFLLFPQVDAVANGGRQETLQSSADDFYDAGFDASFELDVFGQRRNRVSAAGKAIEALQADYHDVTLTLIADIVRSYISFRQGQKQVEIDKKNLQLQQETLDLIVALYDAGESPLLDVERSRVLVNQTGASVSTFQRQADSARFQLTVLTAQLPEDLSKSLQTAKSVPVSSALPVLSAPADIVAQRPDVRAAIARLEQSTALSKAAIRDLFPSLNLSGFYGVAENSFSSSNPIWDVTLGAAVTLLDFGRLEGQIDSAQAREVQAFEAYRQTILEAVVEVETALNDYAQTLKEQAALQKSFKAAERAFKLSKDLYSEGEVSFLDVLDAHRTMNETETAYVSAKARLSESLTRLYKSLGVY